MKATITGIMTAFTAAPGGVTNSFYNALGGRMYLDEAPEGAEMPYCVFMVVSGTPERTFSEIYTDALIQFSLFSSSSGAGEVADLYDYLKALYDEKALTISGSTLVWCRESNLQPMIDEITTTAGTEWVRHWAVDYNIYTSLN
jgi:hypothetical protein